MNNVVQFNIKVEDILEGDYFRVPWLCVFSVFLEKNKHVENNTGYRY